MNDEKWADIVNLIDQKFEVLDKTREESSIGDDFEEDKAKEVVENVFFVGPMGKMKVQRITRPIIIDKKSHYTKRMGTSAKTETIYSKNEFSHKFKAFKWDSIDNDWVEIEARNFELS